MVQKLGYHDAYASGVIHGIAGGFALGVDRTLLACDDEAVFGAPDASVDVFVVDTTGGGDSFRAGIVYALLAGWDDARAMRFAAAVAALNCTRFPGVLNSPSLNEVEAFIDAARPAR